MNVNHSGVQAVTVDNQDSCPESSSAEVNEYLLSCVSLDLEVNKGNQRIRAFAAIRHGTGESLTFQKGNLAHALHRLDEFSTGASFILGHNLIAFDLPHLAAANPNLRLLNLPAVDTLRLSPLAFPKNPYHHLVKHYQDGQLKRGQLNDPELDARLTFEVLVDQYHAFMRTEPDLLLAWHWLTTLTPEVTGVDTFFSLIRESNRPSDREARKAIYGRFEGNACLSCVQGLKLKEYQHGWALAYALAWLSVCSGNSVMPPWVRHQFPEAGKIVRRLRDKACINPDCAWCRTRHDAVKELQHWFPFKAYRPKPADSNGRSLQQSIVEAALGGDSVLGILPTGTGKSLCYQVPALSRYDKTGALTVVISPLVALMADQVQGLEKHNIGSCVTINGLLSMPERAEALDRVRLGDAGILLISPEQLRNKSVSKAIKQREIGFWVVDEAHCLSKWGHDFRPDYRYLSRFIKKSAEKQTIPPLLCLTATAKPEVVTEIQEHFQEKLGIDLKVFDGGANRDNLEFTVVPTTGGEKFQTIVQILRANLDQDASDGAIVYCATRRQAEEIAEYLQINKVNAGYFHAGLSPELKKDIQKRFIDGELRVITATNAFGMGIDKPDVRLVIHADIPGSLESYLQESGRAGRDRKIANCILLYSMNDVERQFGLSARSRLKRAEIHGILRALRNLDRKKRMDGEVVATSGEILNEDEDSAFEKDSTTDDTRVRTAIAWLEDAILLTREENRVNVFPSSLRVSSVAEAEIKLANVAIQDKSRGQLLRIVEKLIDADSDEGISTDELMGVTDLDSDGIREALTDLEKLGISSNDTALTAFVHVGVQHQSTTRYDEAAELENTLIELMRENAPDQEVGETQPLHLRSAAQFLRNKGIVDVLPSDRVHRILNGIAKAGRGDQGGTGCISTKKRASEVVQVTLNREWSKLVEAAELRRTAAKFLLDHLISSLPAKSRGLDLLAETTLGNLLHVIESDLLLRSRINKPEKLLQYALLWLHDQEVIRLHRGMAIFRSAMTIRLADERRGFGNSDYVPLDLHYKRQVLQIHIMIEFARRGLEAMTDALRLAMDYFTMDQDAFLKRWLPDREKEISRETTSESWRQIVETLKNPIQQRIVADNREKTNLLVLAGPGSGKTRVLVHRIAYLVRARRENPRGILALAYNRHAAVEIRRRLRELIGDDAKGVTVHTCHAVAMRLVGSSFLETADRPDSGDFNKILKQAVDLLGGSDLPPEEVDMHRDRLLSGFRWILVDEYQDIDSHQYALISALARRTEDDEDSRLHMFAVGDDDQNIYAFNGASVEFIKRFESDYNSKPAYLTDNYRSTQHVILAANALILPARQRMKSRHPIQIDRNRKKDAPGGILSELDPVSQGKVQILYVRSDLAGQVHVAMAELQRLSGLVPNWDWAKCAVIAREWKYLDPIRAYCEDHDIPVQMGNQEFPSVWRLRESQMLVNWLRQRDSHLVSTADIAEWLDGLAGGPWIDLLRQALEEFALENADVDIPVEHFIEWLAEWGREVRRRQHGLLLLTAHRAKGLEFDHIVVLDGGWDRTDSSEDPDAARRLYYVAMTRARLSLALICTESVYSRIGSLRTNFISENDQTVRAIQQHRLLRDLTDTGSVLIRPSYDEQQESHYLARHYRCPSLNEIDLGFAGRYNPSQPVHKSIKALKPGDPLQVRVSESGRVELLDHSGNLVGRLASKYTPPTDMNCVLATVFAVVVWNKDTIEPQKYMSPKCESWEVIVPELLFVPETQNRTS